MGDEDKAKTAADAQETDGSAQAGAAKDGAAAPAHVPVDPPGSTPPAAQASNADQGDSTATNDKPQSNDRPEEEGDDNVQTPEKSAKEDKISSAEDTAATAAAEDDPEESKPSSPTVGGGDGKPVAILASSKKARPPYKYDPNKITLRFIFANRDGLTVTVECKPSDTVGEVKGALLSVWPEDLPDCEGGELLRLICMGKGFLMPDTRTLEDCQIPVFKTHPTPINVSVKPNVGKSSGAESPSKSGILSSDPAATSANDGTQQTSQGCACIIL